MKPYRFIKETSIEFHEHVAYFDEHAPSVTNRFVAEVYDALHAVRGYPEIGSPVTKRTRRRVLHTFPYDLVYMNNPDTIVIIAIAPHRRRGYWRKRLRDRGPLL